MQGGPKPDSVQSARSDRRARRRRGRGRRNKMNNRRESIEMALTRVAMGDSPSAISGPCSHLGEDLHALREMVFRQQRDMVQMNETIRQLSGLPNKLDIAIDWVLRGISLVREHVQGQYQVDVKVEPTEQL